MKALAYPFNASANSEGSIKRFFGLRPQNDNKHYSGKNAPQAVKHSNDFTYLTHFTNSTKAAFTLAEVLITLAIIGIVAALTIPTLVQSYKRKIVETRVVNFVSTISNVLKLAQIDNGDIMTWELGSLENHRDSEVQERVYNTYFKPYMKNVKTTVKNSTPTDSISGNGVFDIYLNDGSVIRIDQIRTYDIGFHYYPQGMKDNIKKFKSHGICGEDYFSFVFYKNISHGTLNAYYHTGGYKNYTHDDWLSACARVQINARGASCTILLEENNWKIPEDYPHKF